jgi:hypothetical protein
MMHEVSRIIVRPSRAPLFTFICTFAVYEVKAVYFTFSSMVKLTAFLGLRQSALIA